MRQRRLGACLLATSLAIAATVATTSASALVDQGDATTGTTDGSHTSTVDVRRTADLVAPTADQLDAARAALDATPDRARMTWDDRFGTPRTIHARGATLTGPQSGAASDLARQWLSANRDLLGLTGDDVADLAQTGDHELSTGTHVVSFAQVVDGVQAVHGGTMSVVVRDDGSIESYAGQTARSGDLLGAWDLTAADALTGVAASLTDVTDFVATQTGTVAGYTTFAPDGFAASSYVSKAVFVTADGAVPAWQVLFIDKLDRAFDVMVDARTGEELFRDSLVDHLEPEGTVYENFPGAEHGGDPVVKSFGPTEESPAGWVDPTGLLGLNGVTTAGNNANSYANWSNFLVPADEGPRPVDALGHFNYAFADRWGRTECEAIPPSYAEDVESATTNLFYHHNRVHDEFYSYGFTESGGNFQINNNGNGGNGGDPILGLVQAGAVSGGAPLYTGRDNAYMLTLPDGIPPWSGMFLWEPINDVFEGECRDGDFDASVIEHEYAHGLTNRYVSAEDNALGSHQSGAMGEGWGDWYGLNHLHREGLYDKSVVGEYAVGNGQRGIRNWPYDSHPGTFGDIGYDMVGAQVHADGELWSATLWDYRAALVAEFGQQRASDIAALTVTDAMPRSPADPSFIDMRDAIALAIDDRYHRSDDYETIVDIFWTQFAQRGLGLHAATDGGDDLDPTPAFNHPSAAANGMLSGRVVNASTNKPIADAKVIIGEFEARVSPLRTTGDQGGFAAPVVAGTYPVTVQARGFGSQTFHDVEVVAGETTRLRLSMSPNLASLANGAEVVGATSANARALFDDTEASTWTNVTGGNVVVELGAPAEISSVQVSAYTTSRFEALQDFTLQVSTDGLIWHNALVVDDGFDFQRPRPVTPDVHYKTFELDEPVEASHVRFWTDTAIGETKTDVQAAELQVFSGTVKHVEPLPPPPPDDPITDSGTIAFSTPGGDAVDGGVTAVDFATNCIAPPATQGSDGWVTTLPDSFGDGLHEVKVVGDPTTPHDFDLYFFSADCQVLGSAASAAADEAGTIPSGTKYVLSHLWLGAAKDFTLTAVDTQ